MLHVLYLSFLSRDSFVHMYAISDLWVYLFWTFMHERFNTNLGLSVVSWYETARRPLQIRGRFKGYKDRRELLSRSYICYDVIYRNVKTMSRNFNTKSVKTVTTHVWSDSRYRTIIMHNFNTIIVSTEYKSQLSLWFRQSDLRIWHCLWIVNTNPDVFIN